jgi:hypothetical protein
MKNDFIFHIIVSAVVCTGTGAGNTHVLSVITPFYKKAPHEHIAM